MTTHYLDTLGIGKPPYTLLRVDECRDAVVGSKYARGDEFIGAGSAMCVCCGMPLAYSCVIGSVDGIESDWGKNCILGLWLHQDSRLASSKQLRAQINYARKGITSIMAEKDRHRVRLLLSRRVIEIQAQIAADPHVKAQLQCRPHPIRRAPNTLLSYLEFLFTRAGYSGKEKGVALFEKYFPKS